MKALSIKQPYANLIADGHKTIEMRTWRTMYRGDLLLCSSKQPDIAPAGMAVATAELVACRPMIPGDVERALRDYERGLVSWVLQDVKKIAEPFPVRGRLMLFDVELPAGFWSRHDWCRCCHGEQHGTACPHCHGNRQDPA